MFQANERHNAYTPNSKTAFTRCRYILKTMENVTITKFELAFTRYRHDLQTIENSKVANSMKSLQEFDVNEMLRIV